MKIHSIEINNFYSIKHLELSFDDYNGITVVEGINNDSQGSNGAGKSALFEAVVWALFGKTIRKSNEEALINNREKRDCWVKIRINENVIVTRGRKPSRLEVLVDDSSITQQSMAQTQECLEELLGTNYKVFMASAIFGQHNHIDFLGASPDDKRTIVRNFLNLDDIFQKRDRIRGHKSRCTQEIKTSNALLDEHLATREDLMRRLADIESDKSKYIYTDEEINLDEILEKEALLRDLMDKNRSLHHERRRLRGRLSDLRRILKSDPSSCPTCGANSPIAKDPVRTAVATAQGEIDKISKKTVNLEKRLSKINIPISSEEYSEYLKYKELCSKASTFTELLDEVNDKIVEIDAVKLENAKNYEVMRFWEKAFSEQGMIRYIIRNILSYFNDKCNTYLSYLTNGQFLVHFNEKLEESITNGGKITHYISLSGGEKRKINLAVMLALQSLLDLTSNDQSNIVFFDEVAENLDEEGIKGLYILLQELKKERKIFLITHNKYLNAFLDNSRKITIIKHKGISKLAGAKI